MLVMVPAIKNNFKRKKAHNLARGQTISKWDDIYISYMISYHIYVCVYVYIYISIYIVYWSYVQNAKSCQRTEQLTGNRVGLIEEMTFKLAMKE